MATSKQTITDIYMVLQAHISLPKRTRILHDLGEVRGNKSFTQTVQALKELHDRLLATRGLLEKGIEEL